MPNMTEILKQIQRDLTCPVCGRKFELSQIKVRGVFEQILIIQTECNEGHFTLFVTAFSDHAKKIKPAINMDEVLDLSNNLKKFNGDFEKLWKQSI